MNAARRNVGLIASVIDGAIDSLDSLIALDALDSLDDPNSPLNALIERTLGLTDLPNPTSQALTFDECEAAGVDGTLRTL